MAGVRMRHATDRSCIYVLVDAGRPYTAPLPCLVCGVVHTFKTYHIALDGNGAAIVSPEVAAKVGSLGPGTGFTIMEGVAKPPAQGVGLNGERPSLPPVVVNQKLKEPGRG